MIEIPDYDLYRTDRDSRGGGVCIFLKKAVFKHFTTNSFSYNYGSIEVIGVDCTYDSQIFSMVCIYRPPSSSLYNDQMLCDKIKLLSGQKQNLMIFGDFNFPNISWPNMQLHDNDESSILFTDMILETSLAQLVILDLILTNDSNMLGDIKQCPPIGISDHCVIETSIQYHTPSERRYNIRQFAKINFESLNSDLLDANWKRLHNSQESIEAWSIFTCILGNLIQKNTSVFKTKYNIAKPWITQYFIKRAKSKKLLWFTIRL